MQSLKYWLNKIDAGLVLAGLFGLFVIQNLLQPGLPTVADLPIHLYRTLEFKEAWAPGVIVPRWAPNLAYGYGYPLFIFAPPLPYLLGLAFLWPGLSIEAALKLVIIFSILLYAGGMYLLARDVLNSVAAGLVAAAAYLFAPFALREALLYGGNVPQLLAIGFFPWTLWAMTGAARQRSWGWIGLAALFYAAVLLSHLFQGLIFTAVAGLYGLLLGGYAAGRAGRPARLGEVVRRLPAAAGPLLALLLGLLLSAFFWLPAFIERVFTRAQASIYLEKSPFFVRYPHWPELVAWIQPLDDRAANPYVPLTLGVITLVLAGLGLTAALAGLIAGRNRTVPAADRLPPPAWLALFLAIVAAGAALLTLPVSRPLWETVSILQVAEFPWRTLGLVNLGLAFLAGYALLPVPLKYRWPAAVVCLLALLLAVGPYLYPVTGFTRYAGVGLAEQVDYERRSQSIGTTTLGEYLPRSVEVVPTGSPMVESFLAGQEPDRLDRTTLPAGASATLLEQNAVTYRYRLNSPAGFSLRLYQFAFPGWTARLNDVTDLPLSPESETGLIRVDVPAGQHTLTIHFGETPIRVAGLAVSGLTLLGLILVGLVTRRAKAAAGSMPGNRPEEPARLPLLSPGVGLSLMLVLVAALWLKPLLRPVFTITSPPGRALPAQHDTNIEFANGIRLIGYDLSREVVPAGGYLQVVLYWETGTAPMEVNLQPFVHLDRLNDLVTVAANTNYTPGDPTTESNLPTFHWDNSRYVRDEHDLIVPPGTPPLAYAVRVGLIDPADRDRLIPLSGGSGDTARLTTLNVTSDQPPARLAQSPGVTFTSDFGPIRLAGFEIVEISDEQLDFSLAWQTEQRPPRDYTVFAQLLDPKGQLVTGMDRPPLDGAYPTSTWLPGQTIIDRRSIPLAGVPSGNYRLIVGLYDPTSQQRLVTTTGADFALLATINSGSRSQLEPKK